MACAALPLTVDCGQPETRCTHYLYSRSCHDAALQCASLSSSGSRSMLSWPIFKHHPTRPRACLRLLRSVVHDLPTPPPPPPPQGSNSSVEEISTSRFTTRYCVTATSQATSRETLSLLLPFQDSLRLLLMRGEETDLRVEMLAHHRPACQFGISKAAHPSGEVSVAAAARRSDAGFPAARTHVDSQKTRRMRPSIGHAAAACTAPPPPSLQWRCISAVRSAGKWFFARALLTRTFIVPCLTSIGEPAPNWSLPDTSVQINLFLSP